MPLTTNERLGDLDHASGTACKKMATAVPTSANNGSSVVVLGGSDSSAAILHEPMLSKRCTSFPGDDGRAVAATSGQPHAVAARPLTRQWPESKGIPWQCNRLFNAGAPDAFMRWYRRWEAMGRPQSMRRERRARRTASLEHKGNEVRLGDEAEPGRDVVRIVGCGCGRHVCERCGRRLGWRVRANIKRRLTELQSEHAAEGDVMMLTLTCDPKRFNGPRDAWESVRANRRLSRTMQAMGITYYVAVVEFQQSGMPHWHVLVWKPGVVFVGHRELEAAWRVGICRYTARKGRPMEWAVNYITKYITKPDESPPSWVMELHHVRSCWASRAWGPIADDQLCDDLEDADSMLSVDRREVCSNAEAVANCSATCSVLVEHVSQDGEFHRRWMGTIPVHVRIVKRLISRMLGRQVRSMVLGVESAEWRRLRSAMPLVE